MFFLSLPPSLRLFPSPFSVVCVCVRPTHRVLRPYHRPHGAGKENNNNNQQTTLLPPPSLHGLPSAREEKQPIRFDGEVQSDFLCKTSACYVLWLFVRGRFLSACLPRRRVSWAAAVCQCISIANTRRLAKVRLRTCPSKCP